MHSDNASLSIQSILKFSAIWVVSLPLLIIGGYRPAFTLEPEPNYPLGNVIGFAFGTLVETLVFCVSLALPEALPRSLLLVVYVAIGLIEFLSVAGTTDIGGLPLAHAFWLLLSSLAAIIVSLSAQRRLSRAK